MSNKKIVLTSEFRVISSAGQETTVNKHTEFISDPTSGSPEEWTEGSNDYKFSDGSRASRLSDDEFERISDGEVFSITLEKILTE